MKYKDKNIEEIFTENPEDEIWQTILQFSYEANIKKYLNEHEFMVDDDLVDNISGSISQAYEYYNAAKIANLQISPLLLYYGTTNLLNGICNLVSGKINEIHNHGMNIIASSSIDSLAETKVRFENPVNGGVHVFANCMGETTSLTQYGAWTLKEIFSSIPEIRNDYMKCYSTDKSNTVPLDKYITPEGEVEKIYIGRSTVDDVIEQLKLVPNFDKNYLRPSLSMDRTCILLRRKLNSKKISINSYSGQDYLQVGHIKNGNKIVLSQLFYMYIALFSLSSLCRYKPEIWNPFVKRDATGEKLLIEKLLYYSRRLIPNFVLNYVYGKKMIYLSERYTPVDTVKLVSEHDVNEMINKQIFKVQEQRRREK